MYSGLDEAGQPTPGRALKMVPIASLEASIALALRELVGTEYVVDVRQLDFEPTPGAPWSDEVTFSVRAARRRDAPIASIIERPQPPVNASEM